MEVCCASARHFLLEITLQSAGDPQSIHPISTGTAMPHSTLTLATDHKCGQLPGPEPMVLAQLVQRPAKLTFLAL